MNNNEDVSFLSILFGVTLCTLIIYFTWIFEPVKNEVHDYYQVYLSGEKIGLIESVDELYDLIDEEQKEIKEKYKVTKVHRPTGLTVQKVSTFSNNIMSAKEVYNEIKDIEPFTIQGYEVSIAANKNKERDKITFYILNKEDLDTAVKNTVLAFVDENSYNKYLNSAQEEILESGKEITNIYLNDNVTIKKAYISTDEQIFTDADSLSMYFLFGTTKLTDKYKVKSSDTIESIASRNKLGVSDFLIANPEIAGENALLAVGQEVTVAHVSPLSDIVVESFETEYQTIRYETKVVLDKSLNASDSYVKQQGSNGLAKVKFATKEMNGKIINAASVENEVIREAVDKIVVYGSKNVVYFGNTTYWAWPTSKIFRISSRFGWRVHPVYGKGHFHSGVDISGTTTKDIYAIQSGVVKNTAWGFNSGAGNNIVIDHGNGYWSQYMHLSKILVKKGEKVEKGQLIGIMGRTGTATGVHLHLTIKKLNKKTNKYELMDPLLLYK